MTCSFDTFNLGPFYDTFRGTFICMPKIQKTPSAKYCTFTLNRNALHVNQ